MQTYSGVLKVGIRICRYGVVRLAIFGSLVPPRLRLQLAKKKEEVWSYVMYTCVWVCGEGWTSVVLVMVELLYQLLDVFDSSQASRVYAFVGFRLSSNWWQTTHE